MNPMSSIRTWNNCKTIITILSFHSFFVGTQRDDDLRAKHYEIRLVVVSESILNKINFVGTLRQ